MSSTRYVCKETFLDRVTIARGTTADSSDIGGPFAVLRLTIVAPAQGSDVHPGETLDVPRGDFYRLWEPLNDESPVWEGGAFVTFGSDAARFSL